MSLIDLVLVSGFSGIYLAFAGIICNSPRVTYLALGCMATYAVSLLLLVQGF